jgi:light-regulated signal transduction histidine kinase (bacteriophytochrome)
MPGRIVANYSQLIGKNYEDKLDAEGVKYIEYIRESVNRMYALIDDLLNYSSLGSNYEPMTNVDTEVVVREAMENFKVPIARTGAE